MRPWRKLHSSILESERFADTPLEAKVLFFLLVVAQDDSGYYPWERMKIKHLIAACDWTEAQARKHAQSLVEHGLAMVEKGGIVLHNGEVLNGCPRGDRKPFLYQRQPFDIPVTVTDSHRHAIETETETEYRGDDRNRPSWTPPEWFVPLTTLSGYKNTNHSKAAKGIEAACVESGANVVWVVLGFAKEWPTLKLKYRWNDPVSTLKGKPLEIAINNSKNGGNNATTQPDEDRLAGHRKDAKFLQDYAARRRTV